MSTQDGEFDDRPSKGGPLNYAPKSLRRGEPEPNRAAAPGTDGVAPLHQGPVPHTQAPESAEELWKRINQRPAFAGDLAIVERRRPPSRNRHVPARRLAGVVMVAAVGFISYRLGSLSLPPGSPPQAVPAGQPDQRTLVAKQSDAPRSPEPASASRAAPDAITPPANDQKSGEKRELMDRGVLAPAKPEPREHNASEIAVMMSGARQRLANGDIAGARMMYQRLAKEGEATAALALAETYDPPILRKLNVTGGVAPDVALAQSWYEKAKALGSPVAIERLAAVARLDKVTLVTDFGYKGRHAYFFVALDKGYYRDAGIEVKIMGGQGGADAIRQVAAGNAMFAFGDAFTMVAARANDQIPVKLVAVVYRKPPQTIFCREDAGLKKPKDLEGNTIGAPPGSAIPPVFPAFARAAGFDAQAVRWTIADVDSLFGMLAADKVFCTADFIVGEPLVRSRLAPTKVMHFLFSDAGLSYYSNGIVTTTATIASKPDLVRRFVAATVRGMKDAFADPTAAGAIVHKIVPQVDATVAMEETQAVAELAQIPGQPLGEIDPARIDATVDLVKSTYHPANPIVAADVYAPGFVPK